MHTSVLNANRVRSTNWISTFQTRARTLPTHKLVIQRRK